MTFEAQARFDYAVLMGFMDYVGDPGPVIDKVLGMTAMRAFFSFPAAGGLLAWQRRLRYKRRCDLFLYSRDDLEKLFTDRHLGGLAIERIERDFFVTAELPHR